MRPSNENPKGFFKRNWPFFLALAILLPLVLSGVLLEVTGALIYAPLLFLSAFLSAGFVRRFFNRTTTESDARDGTHDKLWDALSDEKALMKMSQGEVYALIAKVALHKLEFIAYLIAASIIFAACIK